MFDKKYGGEQGCNIRYNKYSKILSIDFFYNGTLSNATLLTENFNTIGIPIPPTNRNIFSRCFFEDGSSGFMQTVIGTDGNIKIYNNRGLNMVWPMVNGSTYIG